MKVRGRAMGWKWNPKRVTRPGKQDAMQQRCKKAARFGKAQTCVLLSEGQSHYFCLSRVRSSVSEMGKASQTGGRYLGGNRGDQVGAKTIAGEWQIRIGFQVWRKWYLILSAISLCSSISPTHTLDRKLQILPVDERGNSRWETRRQRWSRKWDSQEKRNEQPWQDWGKSRSSGDLEGKEAPTQVPRN